MRRSLAGLTQMRNRLAARLDDSDAGRPQRAKWRIFAAPAFMPEEAKASRSG